MRLHPIVRWLLRPQISMFIAGLIFITVSMLISYQSTLYNSDDVVIQNGLLHWQLLGDTVFYGNHDVGFILHAPIYWLVSLFIEPGRHAMLASGLAIAAINFTLVYVSVLYFFRILKVKISYVTLLPVVWLSSFGYDLSRLFLATNMHNLVVGLIFVFLMIISKLCRGEFDFKNWWSRGLAFAGIILFVGLAIINDRYFMYFGLASAALLIGLYLFRRAITMRRAALLAGLLVAGALLSVVLSKYILPKFGLILDGGVGQPYFVSADNLVEYAVNSLNSLLAITGANFLSEPLISVASIVALVNFVLLGVALFASLQLVKDIKRQKAAPEQYVLVGLLWLVLLTYTFSSFNLGVLPTYRYLVLIPFLLPVILAVYAHRNVLKSRPLRLGYIAIFVLAIGLNLGNTVLVNAPHRDRFGTGDQTPDYQLIDTLKADGLSKGYGNFWVSHINTYLSKGDLLVNPVKCIGEIVFPYAWFVTGSSYTKPSDGSFYLFKAGGDDCSAEVVQGQFGQPVRQITSGQYTAWVYDYDLSTRMDLTEVSSTR